MFSSRFLWQIWGILGGIVVAGTISFGFLTATQVEADARQNIERSIRSQTLIFRELFLPYLQGKDSIDQLEFANLTKTSGNRVTIVDPGGTVLADNREDPAVMDNHGNRPEILAAWQQAYGVSERYSDTLQQDMLYVAIAVRDGPSGEGLGVVRVAVPLLTIQQQVASLRLKIVISALVFGGISLLLGFLLAQRVTEPVAEMTTIASDIARGHYELRLPVGRQDEIGQLGVALNELAAGTQARIQELTSSRNQLAAVLAGMAEGLIAVDLDQKILHLNEAARRMLSLGSRNAADRALQDIVDVPEIHRAVENCLLEYIGIHSSFSLDDETFDLAVLLLRDGDDTTSAAGAIIVIQDVTERLRLDKVRSDFVANASHELKTPISAIRGYVDTIVDDPDMPVDTTRQFLSRVQKQTERLDNIVRDLLQLSRFDSQQGTHAFKTIDLGALVREVFIAKREDAELNQVSLTLEAGDDLHQVAGENEAMQQMVVNLVDNAIKYSDAVTGEVKLRLYTLGSLAVIEVEDNGIGIPEDEQERIFERFYRVDRARSREKGGTGLGLAIVKHIAQSHGGSVSVESTPDVGSRFKVNLPLVRQESPIRVNDQA